MYIIVACSAFTQVMVLFCLFFVYDHAKWSVALRGARHTHVPMSPSSIWYRSIGTVMSWRRTGHVSHPPIRAHGLRHAPHLGYLILYISALLANKRVQYTWRGFCSHAGMLLV